MYREKSISAEKEIENKIDEPREKKSHCVKQRLVMTSTVNDKPNVFILSCADRIWALVFFFRLILIYWSCICLAFAASGCQPPLQILSSHPILYGIKNNITQTKVTKKIAIAKLEPMHPGIWLIHFVIIFSYLRFGRAFFSLSLSSYHNFRFCNSLFLLLHSFHSMKFTFYKYIESNKDQRTK